MRSVPWTLEQACFDQRSGRVDFIWRLPGFEGLGCWYIPKLAAGARLKTAARFDVYSWRNNPLSMGVTLKGLDENELVDDRPFRVFVGCSI